MGRKGGLASLFSSRHSSKPASAADAPWPWPSCAAKPQTSSFRRQGGGGGDIDDRPCTTAAGAAGRLRPPRKGAGGDEMYKTVNSVYFDAADSWRFFFDDGGAGGEDAADEVDDDLDDEGFSTTTASEEWSEAVIRSLGRTSTDRFFFDAGPAPAASNSILAASPGRPMLTRTLAPPPGEAPRLPQAPSSAPSDDDGVSSEAGTDATELPSLVEESVAVALDSEDPFGDFRASMHEMVAAHGLRDWVALQEMLLWYLRINSKHNHALIVGAFVDLLVGLAASDSTSSSSAAATTATMTVTTTVTTTCSSSGSSTSSSGGITSTTTAAMEEQCGCGGGVSAGASCSSASDTEEDAAAGERSTDAHHCTSSGAVHSPCS